MYLPQLDHIPSFSTCLLDDVQPSCIFPVGRGQLRQCKNRVNKQDRQTASALRGQIDVLNPFEDYLHAHLHRYAQLCCCIKYHRRQIAEDDLIKLVCRRWTKELQAAYLWSTQTSQTSKAVLSAPNVPHIKEEVIVKEDIAKLECLKSKKIHTTHQELQAKHVPRTYLAPSKPIHHPSKQTIPGTSKEEEGQNNHHIRSKITHPGTQLGVVSRDLTPSPPSRVIETRSKTGTLLWSFKPRPIPAETTMIRLLIKQVSKYSSRPGIVYLYTRESDPGYIKIGFTTRTTKIRLKEWGNVCNYKPRLLYETEMISNVMRVEALVQQELAIRGCGREESHCKHNKLCPTSHKEWFEVSLKDAIETVEGWVSWMRDVLPYDGDGWLRIPSTSLLVAQRHDFLKPRQLLPPPKVEERAGLLEYFAN